MVTAQVFNHCIPDLKFDLLVISAIAVRDHMKTKNFFCQFLLYRIHPRIHHLDTLKDECCQHKGKTDAANDTK